MSQTPSTTSAQHLMETIPLIMGGLRSEMRLRFETDVPFQHLRALAFIKRTPKGSLSDIAEQVGVLLPSMSKIVDALVERKLILRRPSSDDRRRIILTLTKKGDELVEAVFAATRERIEQILSDLTPQEHETIVSALILLQSAFERRLPRRDAK